MTMQLACVLLLLLPGVTSQEAPPCQAGDETCALAEASELSVSLFQHSLSVLPADKGSAAHTAKVPVSELQSGKQLHDELHHAKQARKDVLASLQQWDSRIKALEARLLQTADAQNPPPITKEQVPSLYMKECKNVRMGVLSGLFLLVVIYIFYTINKYEGSRDAKEMDPPWYLDSKTCSAVLSWGGLLWLLTGMIMFTEFMWFTDDTRHLTCIEALYVTAQIVTTVGYGDMTPSSEMGKVFMAFYALTGVAIIGTLVQTLIAEATEELEEITPDENAQRLFGKYTDAMLNILPVLGVLAFGTIFYSQFPGEQKTVFEAFYMSTITLLTIGFGAYHPVTQTGKMIGALWMIVGVAIVGNAICTLTAWAQKQQSSQQAQAKALKLFREMDADGSGSIDKMEFLNFELVRQGLKTHTADQIMQEFTNLDKDNSGTLDFQEFQKYVENNL